MLKLRKNCKKDPKRIVRVRKNGNLREATVDNIFLVFQDSNKERLLEEVDHYLRELGEVEKADVKILKNPKKSWRYREVREEKSDFIDYED
jgi:hypothetical protein